MVGIGAYKLLMMEIRHGLEYQGPRNYGGIGYMGHAGFLASTIVFAPTFLKVSSSMGLNFVGG